MTRRALTASATLGASTCRSTDLRLALTCQNRHMGNATKLIRGRRSLRSLTAMGTAILLGIYMASCTSSQSSHIDSLRGLEHKVGVYHLTSAADVPSVAAMGGRLILAADDGDTALTKAMSAHHIRYIDQATQRVIHRAYCPRGKSPCHALTASGKRQMLQALKAHVDKVSGTDMVAAYYLLDDYYIDMGPGIRAAYQLIHSIDPTTPTVCAFYQGLGYVGPNHDLKVPTRSFARALRNYSPAWCDAVAIYSYAPAEFAVTAPPKPEVDWSMESTLPSILATLKRKGWDPRSQPLIGMPGAFGYEPRSARAGQPPFPRPEWRFAPSSYQLARQIRAFCAVGATVILPYVWDDGSVGTIKNLSNSPQLRAGFAHGVQQCRTSYWSPAEN